MQELQLKLRQLEEKDAPFMLEWLHDERFSQFFQFDGQKMTEQDVLKYITDAHQLVNTKHFAVVDRDDQYLGTISLKNIDHINKNAEYAICMRVKAMGKGISKIATDMILEYAFKELKLHKVYLNVFSDNTRAIKFYEKYGFVFEGEMKEQVYSHEIFKDLKYFAIFNR